MDPEKLRALLAILNEAGVRRAVLLGPDLSEVEFWPGKAAAPVTTTTFVDPRTGEPVDLSAGAPELADDSVDAAIAARNFEPGKKP